MSMCCGKIKLPTSVVRKSLMAKTWYPTSFSGFYVNGKSYHKLTGVAMEYKDVSLQWENKKIEKKLTLLPFRLVSDETADLVLWCLFMVCVTTRLKMEILMFFLSLTLENARKLGKLAKFLLVVCEPRKYLGKKTKNGHQKFRNLPDKM